MTGMLLVAQIPIPSLEDPVALRRDMNTRMTQLCRTNEAVLDSDFSADI